MMRIILVLLYLSLLVGCDGNSNANETKAVAKAAALDQKRAVVSAGTLFTREITKQPCDLSYANSLNVRVRNFKFTVAFNRKGEPRLYRDEIIALAEAVLKNLPD